MTDGEISFIRDLYDEEIRFTDAAIGRLLDTLREVGAYDNTLIVVTADHGEEFLGHGWIGHTRTLYEELIRVPLIVKEPGGRRGPAVVDETVSLTSLTPTVVELLGIAGRPEFQAASLAPLLRSASGQGPGAAFSEVDFVPIRRDRQVKRTHKKAVVTDRYKIIRDDSTGVIEVYDVAAEPAELNDLAESRPQLVERLLPLLESYVAAAGQDAHGVIEARISECDVEKLRSLGYVGGE